MDSINEKKLSYLEFIHRENEIRHHHYDEEMLQYNYLKVGDLRAIEEGEKMFSSSITGHLSDDPVRNAKYLFVASITLATRFAIEGGMDEETSYNTSDLFIQKMDLCNSVEEIQKLQKDMFSFFTNKMASIEKQQVYSKPIILCLDYIYYHLHQKILLKNLAEYVNLNPNYLSELFKKECKITISQYILKKRMEAATNMLIYSDYTYSQIASTLAFSSQSHFSKVFKEYTGETPKKYREKFLRLAFSKSK